MLLLSDYMKVGTQEVLSIVEISLGSYNLQTADIRILLDIPPSP